MKSDIKYLGHISAYYQTYTGPFEIDYNTIIFWENYVGFQIKKNLGKFTWIDVANRYPLKTINKLNSYKIITGLCFSSVIITNETTWIKVFLINCDKNISAAQYINVYDNTQNGELDPV